MRGSAPYEAYSVKGGAQRRKCLQMRAGSASRFSAEQIPYHLISGRLAEPAPLSRMRGPVCEARKMGPIIMTASKPLALPVHIHPASSRATVVASRRTQDHTLITNHAPLRHQPLCYIPPQGDHQFGHQSNDHCAADAQMQFDGVMSGTDDDSAGAMNPPEKSYP
jgi:hypothetical protein